MSARASLATLVGIGLVTVVGCTGDDAPAADPSPSASATAAPSPAATPEATRAPLPEQGVCRKLRFPDAVSVTDDSPTVPCDGSHTSFTFSSGRLDAVSAEGNLLAVDSQAVADDVATRCPERFAKFIGGSQRDRRLSMLGPIWFTPTVPEFEEGADWFRCDLVAVNGAKRLAELGPGRAKNMLDRVGARERFAMCGTAAPDATDFQRVLCSSAHSWRAVDIVAFEGRQYPGRARARERGQAPCEDAGARVAADPLDFEWAYEFPTAQQWDAGQRFGRCWAPD